MLLDVKRIVNTPGGRIPFEFSEDFSDVDFGGVCPAVRPVLVVGQVRNIAGMLRLELALDTTLAAVCDRCGEVFDKPFHLDCEYLLATELEDEENDEILLLEDGTVDLGELSREVFILNMPTKLLCREDCRGLCPGCGVNLNYEVCRCSQSWHSCSKRAKISNFYCVCSFRSRRCQHGSPQGESIPRKTR